jgi:hypothetical protein
MLGLIDSNFAIGINEMGHGYGGATRARCG